MAAKTVVNNMTVVHKSSNGVVTTFPDVCKTPSPGGPVPVPYPNVAQSTDTANGTKTVKVDGNPIAVKGSNFRVSTGDEAGSAGGVVSSKIKGKAEFVNYSFDVKADGKSVARLLDPMLSNKGGAANTPPAPELQPPQVAVPAGSAEPEEIHVLRIAFCFKQASVVTGTTERPRFETAHTVKGPEQRRYESTGEYGGAYYEGVQAGDYTLEFETFDTNRRDPRKRTK